MVPGAAVQDLTPAGDGGVASSAVLTEETAGMILQHPTLPPFSSSISPPFSPPVVSSVLPHQSNLHIVFNL